MNDEKVRIQGYTNAGKGCLDIIAECNYKYTRPPYKMTKEQFEANVKLLAEAGNMFDLLCWALSGLQIVQNGNLDLGNGKTTDPRPDYYENVTDEIKLLIQRVTDVNPDDVKNTDPRFKRGARNTTPKKKEKQYGEQSTSVAA